MVIPTSLRTPHTSLRGWILKQRNEYKRLRSNEPSLLTARRLQMLNDLGLEWNNKKTLKWSERFDQLKRFKNKHGHCIVPRNYDEADAAGLGKWVAQQRHAYKLRKEGKTSTMTAERAKLFNDIGMVWSILKQPETRAERLPWEERFKQLLAYKERQVTPWCLSTTPMDSATGSTSRGLTMSTSSPDGRV